MFDFPTIVRLVVALIAIVLPLVLARYLNHRYDTSWRLFLTGCVTFVLSQVVHIPFNVIMLRLMGFNSNEDGFPSDIVVMVGLAVFLGFSAGIFEELSRYLAYRHFLTSPENRSWKSALMFGSGHGGIESILLVGIGGLLQLAGMTYMRGKDLSEIGIPEDQIEQLEEQIEAYWAAPWYQCFLADIERVSAITCHLAMTILVLQCFRRRNHMWLLASICWHAMIDCLAVLLMAWTGPYCTELGVGIMAAGSLAIIWVFREDGYEDMPTEDGSQEFTRFSDLNDEPGAESGEVDMEPDAHEEQLC